MSIGKHLSQLSKRVDLESLLVDWKRVNMFHKNWTLLREILQSHSNNSSFLEILVLVK